MYGHRGPNEFELSHPRPAEDPDWLDRQLAQFDDSQVDVDQMLAEQRERFEAAWRRLRESHPRQAAKLKGRIDEVVPRSHFREAARSEYIRDRWVVRTLAVRAGQLLDLEEDVFFLTLQELLEALSGDPSAFQFLPARKETYARFSALPPYPSIIRGRFDAFQWAADPQRRSDIYDTTASSEPDAEFAGSSQTITGAAGSAGRAEGVVRRLDSAEQGELLQPGEILVTVQTDIAWTLLFPRAAAIVTDVGAPLSHAAIVARELGIPAVVGCGDATMRLNTGDRIRVDGSRGVVEIL
jgi:pyruvate,water dikinase